MNRSAVIQDESDRLAVVLGGTDPSTVVPTCPAWTATDLLWHLTEVHDFWARILSDDVRDDAGVAAIEKSKPERPSDPSELPAMRADATARMIDALGRLDDDEPRWSWWSSDQTVGFTRRMQTYEATMHRIDAELAAGVPVSPIPRDVAAGAVDHAIDVMWGWMPDWATYEPLTLAEFRATDSEDVWLVEVGHWFGTGPDSGNSFDEPRAARGTPGDPQVSISAPVEQLARWAWVRNGSVVTDGDRRATDALDTLIANGMQ